MAVFPPPMTVYPDAGSSRRTRSFGGARTAPSSTVKPGTWRDGIDDSV